MTMWHSPPLLGQARCQTLDPTILNVLQWFAFSFTQTYPAHGCKGVKVGGEKQLADLLMNYTSVAESGAYLPVLDCRLLLLLLSSLLTTLLTMPLGPGNVNAGIPFKLFFLIASDGTPVCMNPTWKI